MPSMHNAKQTQHEGPAFLFIVNPRNRAKRLRGFTINKKADPSCLVCFLALCIDGLNFGYHRGYLSLVWEPFFVIFDVAVYV